MKDEGKTEEGFSSFILYPSSLLLHSLPCRNVHFYLGIAIE
jgi:hypothetical protein